LEGAPIQAALGKKKSKGKNKTKPRYGVLDGTLMDLDALADELRAFVLDLSRASIDLPPLDHESRQFVHSLALCFGLKSKSSGKKKAAVKPMMLSKTTRTIAVVNEDKLGELLRIRTGRETKWSVGDFLARRGRVKGGVRHRDGDIVGRKAAKIEEDNVGFK